MSDWTAEEKEQFQRTGKTRLGVQFFGSKKKTVTKTVSQYFQPENWRGKNIHELWKNNHELCQSEKPMKNKLWNGKNGFIEQIQRDKQ